MQGRRKYIFFSPNLPEVITWLSVSLHVRHLLGNKIKIIPLTDQHKHRRTVGHDLLKKIKVRLLLLNYWTGCPVKIFSMQW